MTDHKTAREALEFYANPKAYRNRNPILDEFDPEACIHGAIHDDKGKRATEALSALDRIEAVQSPAVPQEVVENIRSLSLSPKQLIDAAETSTGAAAAVGYNKAVGDVLALLGGKEG